MVSSEMLTHVRLGAACCFVAGALFTSHIALAASAIDELDTYRYALELNNSPKICAHMGEVFSTHFKQPWDYRAARESGKKAELLPGVSLDERQTLATRFSLYPTAPEFEAIKWREGRAYVTADSKTLVPVLVASIDMDGDGKEETVVKHQFMRSVRPAAKSVPGGNDQLLVLATKSSSLVQPLSIDDLRKKVGDVEPRTLAYFTLRYTDADRPKQLDRDNELMSARLIRPFVYEQQTYLSVYVQWAADDPNQRKEWMWVMKYRGGGARRDSSRGDGSFQSGWQAAAVEKLCRFRMNGTPSRGN
jgi:hypothetical protein